VPFFSADAISFQQSFVAFSLHRASVFSFSVEADFHLASVQISFQASVSLQTSFQNWLFGVTCKVFSKPPSNKRKKSKKKVD
jgi:hypothetical protein